MLKIKKELNYRRGGASRNCGGCDHFVRFHQCIGIGGEDIGRLPRCKVIGLKPGRMYRVHEKNVCDRYCNDEGLRRLIGDDELLVKLKGAKHEAA